MRRTGIGPPLLIALMALGMTGSAFAQGYGGRTADDTSLPAGTVLKVSLDQRLNSAQARAGQRFTATARPEEDNSGLPPGTRVTGVVREARAATKSQPGVLDVNFTALEFPDGRSYPIAGALNSLDSKSVSRTASGRFVSKRSSSQDRMKFIGYGAGAGALIGLLTKGNLLTNALLGAAGGYLYSQLQKDKATGGYRNVDLKEGAEFGVRLDQRFAYLPVSDRRPERTLPDVSVRDRTEDAARGRRDRTSDREREPSAFRSGIGVTINDRAVSFDAARPMREGGTVLVPLAPVLRAAGIRYFYNPLSREVSVNGARGNVRTTVGSSVASMNTERVRLEHPVRSVSGNLYVSDQFIELATGMRASWDEGSQTLRLTRSTLDRNVNDRTPGL